MLLGAPASGTVCRYKNHYPRCREHFLAPSTRPHTHLFGGFGLMLGPRISTAGWRGVRFLGRESPFINRQHRNGAGAARPRGSRSRTRCRRPCPSSQRDPLRRNSMCMERGAPLPRPPRVLRATEGIQSLFQELDCPVQSRPLPLADAELREFRELEERLVDALLSTVRNPVWNYAADVVCEWDLVALMVLHVTILLAATACPGLRRGNVPRQCAGAFFS